MKVTDWLKNMCMGVGEMNGQVLQVGIDVKLSTSQAPINELECFDSNDPENVVFIVFGITYLDNNEFKFFRVDNDEVYKTKN